MTQSVDERLEVATELAEVVQAMKNYLMFGQVHADFAQRELLVKFGVDDFQQMAFLAYDKADAFLGVARDERG